MTLPAHRIQGSGDTAVLLLHGIGGAFWSDGAAATARAVAAAGFCAVAVDLPGYGASAAAPGGPDMEEFVAAVQAVIDALATPRTVLVGHSMGGMVALEIVARQAVQAPGGRGGGRVDGLVLACTTAAFGRPGGAWQAQFVAERLAPLEAGLGMAGMARLLVPGLVSPAAPPRVRDLAVEVMSAVPEATYRAALRAIAAFDRREALAAIDVPTLVLAASDDRTATPQVMERMAARIAGSESVCLGGAGHIAPLEDPQAFNGAVVDFLRRRFDPGLSC